MNLEERLGWGRYHAAGTISRVGRVVWKISLSAGAASTLCHRKKPFPRVSIFHPFEDACASWLDLKLCHDPLNCSLPNKYISLKSDPGMR